jgi:diacylglycerol kinase family enzyme
MVVNPEATSTTPAGRDVIAHALASDVKLEVAETRHRGHGAALAARAVTDRVDLIVAHGGDGTINEVVNGLLADGPDRDVPMLGVVPGGSANVFAGALGLPRDPLEATQRLLHAIERRRSRRIGLGRAAGRWFTFNAGLGWDAAVVARVERQRARGHEASPMLYARAALTSYVHQRRHAPELTVEIPGAKPVEGVRLAFVSNTDPWTYLRARPVRINPGTSFDGGLGLYALRSLGVGTVLRQVTQVLSPRANPRGGNVIRLDDVDNLRVLSDEPVPLQVDGDLVGDRTDVTFVSVPEALRVAL